MPEPSPEAVEALFLQAADLDPERRSTFLDEQCAGDPDLRSAVEELLHFDDKAQSEPDFLRSPATADRPTLVPGEVVPECFGHYRIVRRLGEGGMGTVYEAEQDDPRRTVALKVMRPGLDAPEFRKRFAQEARILGRLHHIGIAQVYEAGATAGGRLFFAMEFIRGLPLDEHARRRSLTPPARLELLARVCDAVQHAHEQGIIHRDLKPGNILVDETGQPKVLDFGVAHATGGGLPDSTVHTRTGQLIDRTGPGPDPGVGSTNPIPRRQPGREPRRRGRRRRGGPTDDDPCGRRDRSGGRHRGGNALRLQPRRQVVGRQRCRHDQRRPLGRSDRPPPRPVDWTHGGDQRDHLPARRQPVPHGEQRSHGPPLGRPDGPMLAGLQRSHRRGIHSGVPPQGTRIASAGRDRAIWLWEPEKNEEVARLPGHTSYVWSLAFSPDGGTIVSGSGDRSVRLWDTESLRVRYQARRDAEALRPAAERLVERLFQEKKEATAVVSALRVDPSLSEPQRIAALRVVLKRSANLLPPAAPN
jgi:predicted Ser/Thr protein kinase